MNIYKEDLLPFQEKYPNASELELKILFLRSDGYNYSGIQRVLGNPPKKFIRSVLLKFDPSLIDKDCNYNKL